MPPFQLAAGREEGVAAGSEEGVAPCPKGPPSVPDKCSQERGKAPHPLAHHSRLTLEHSQDVFRGDGGGGRADAVPRSCGEGNRLPA